MGKSTYCENKFLNEVLRGVAPSWPATIYLALYTVTPTAGGGGTEVTGGSYARVAITVGTGAFAAASGGVSANTPAYTFPTATANWGTAVAWALLDAASAGNILFFGALNAPQVINTGNQAQFAAGTLIFTET